MTHIAMSVPEDALTDAFRGDVLDFYGTHFGWTEIDSLRLPDRMTLAVGGGTYVNIRGRAEPMTCSGYEHFGLRLASSEEVEAAWAALDDDRRDVNLEPLDRGEDGYRSFRFRYLLPLTVEVQFFPER